MSGGPNGTIYLPDTKGQWMYVPYPKNRDEGLGDMYYFTISQESGSYTDVDAIYTSPAASGLDAVTFESGREEYNLATYIDAPFSAALGAVNINETPVTYSGVNLPEGATVNETDGTVNWSPTVAGEYIFYAAASAGDTTALKKIAVTVSGSRMDAVKNAIKPYDETAVYTTASLKPFQEALKRATEMAEDESVSDADFTAALNELSDAVAGLELVSPLLKNDPLTDGTSLDFSRMNLGNGSTFGYADTPAWLDAEPGTFVGYWLVENKGAIMDFGIDYKISVNKFGFQARAGFSDRLAGVQVYGSNDRENWEKLTVAEAAYQQAYQTVDVDPEYHDKQYRYLMFKKTTEYPDVLSGSVQNLLEIAEIRMWGTRYETGNLIESITMSSDTVENGRIKMGDTVKLTIQGRDTLNDLKVNIHGVDAAVTGGADNVYTATAVMNSADCKAGQVGFTLNYTKTDGTPGETLYATTDNSSLFLVNSDSFINTGMLAAKLTASSGSWDDKLNAEQSAALLFDGNTDTFGDLKNQFGDYYIADFGEGVTVSLTDIMLMPRASHPTRLNGTVVYGSNDTEHESYDDKEWVQLTPAVSGAAANTWTHFAESDLMSKEAYRFFQIIGAENGDISEVEFYGSYHAAVEMIAGQIQSMDVQEALQTSLVYPSVPSGFTISVESSSNENIISKDGTVRAATEEATVTVTLRVTDKDGNSAVTGNIDVVVKGLDSVITGIKVPARGAQTLTMPSLPEGYTVTVAASDNEEIVSLDEGRITTPEKDTLVTVSLQLTRESDGATVTSPEYTILIYGAEESQELDVNKLAASMYASSGAWGGGLDAVQCAQRLFDGDESTFGDLASGNTYTVDFGEGNAILPTKFRLLPRAGGRNDTEYLGRMNGAFIQGSVDGNEWVNITAPLEGVNEFKYYDIIAEDFLTYGSYRYIRITGAASGNISEVEIYGTTVEAEVPEAEEIDVKNLAAGMTAIAGSWDGKLTAEQCAAQLFDGDESTFGDLKVPDGETPSYTIDFGESITVTPSKFAVFPRDGKASNKTEAEYVDRLNGVKFQGSGNGSDWTDITDEISGINSKDASAFKWHELTVITDGSYRYFKITGGQGGNMAEVKFYGTVNAATAAAVAEETGTAEPEAGVGDANTAADAAPDADSSDASTATTPETDNSNAVAVTTPGADNSDAPDEPTPDAGNSDAPDGPTPDAGNSGAPDGPAPGTDSSDVPAEQAPDAGNPDSSDEPDSDTSVPEVPASQPTDAAIPESPVASEEESTDSSTDIPGNAE